MFDDYLRKEISNLGQFKEVGVYLLRDSEMLSEDGKTILCKLCGKPRNVLAYSRVLGKEHWKVVCKDNTGEDIPILTGCPCQIQARKRIASKRDGHFVKEVDTDKTDLFIDGNHTEEVYSDRRYYRLLHRGYENIWYDTSAFWRMNDEESVSNYQTVRNELDGIFIYDDFEKSFYLYGSELAVALMCAMRNAYLHFGIPCIYAKDTDIMDMIERHNSVAEELETVEVLLIELTGELGYDDIDKLYDLLNLRNMMSKAKTMFCSSADMETVFMEWVSERIVEEIFKSVNGEGNMLRIIG